MCVRACVHVCVCVGVCVWVWVGPCVYVLFSLYLCVLRVRLCVLGVCGVWRVLVFACVVMVKACVLGVLCAMNVACEFPMYIFLSCFANAVVSEHLRRK